MNLVKKKVTFQKVWLRCGGPTSYISTMVIQAYHLHPPGEFPFETKLKYTVLIYNVILGFCAFTLKTN